MTRTRRQLVGGPADGRWVDVEWDDSVYLAPGPPRSVMLTLSGSLTPSALTDEPEVIPYRLATAPTGEPVFLAPGAVYPERFDTKEWVRLRAPHLRDLTRVAPWVWRGLAHVDPADVDPVVAERFIRPRYWEYIGISACGRYEVRQQVADLHLGMRAVNGVDEYHIRDMRFRLAYTQLPTCPEFDCDEKAIATVTPSSGVIGGGMWVYGERLTYRQRFAVCLTHADTLRMLHNGLHRGPDVIDREGNPYVDPLDDHHSMHAARSRFHSYGVVNSAPGNPFRVINIY